MRQTNDDDHDEAVILGRRADAVSPWVTVVGKTVRFVDDGPSEEYHCFRQADYVAVVASTPTGRIPIVRQFRPAVEAYTWELPSGLVDPGESPESTCRRELLEETGVRVREISFLGSFYPDTGRLENRLHAFRVRGGEPEADFVAEPGMQVELVTLQRLREMVKGGEFRHQLHLGVLLAAGIDQFTLDV